MGDSGVYEVDPADCVYYVTAAGRYHARFQVRFGVSELRVLWLLASMGMLAGVSVVPGRWWD
jgi:hypothetical protein